ncbi:MAG: mannose-6-phosphate isomerase [Petrimonas sp.]|jgi:mannose-6-phosphate isomerase|nr:mannose-6-phosphate isomerase [Petrimonas sp.]MDD2910859.1 mannose-6-phosphate isomerase [Petrimonas sp.]MDD3542409.1 mannose-6-phosphate isomerase [Petrimonas sp.]MDD4015924.1 mannose-6-phosphate isomerase [Petrimonas sp.]MDD4535791.1 mannose-6-phosphate isomerase [Petrimonas sp.]
MGKLYPLKFKPILKERIWGGDKLKTYLNKELGDLKNVGESWEISALEGNETTVANGSLKGKTIRELIGEFGVRFLGKKPLIHFGESFPLLIKYIDASDDLSVQVHPDDSVAKRRHNSFGKTEMWYIMQTDEDANIINGFKSDTKKATYLERLEKGELLSLLAHQAVTKGDAVFIPAGRVHALGKGILLAEIQQSSDITYRIFDYNRKDAQGNYRELHTSQALNVIDFSRPKNNKSNYQLRKNVSNKVIHCDYFKTDMLLIENEINRNYEKLLTFKIYMCVEGKVDLQVNVETTPLFMGETILIPSDIEEVKLISENAKVLEIYI